MSECTCGVSFLDAEDYRDHLPCQGTWERQEIRRLRVRVAELEREIREAAQDARDCGRV